MGGWGVPPGGWAYLYRADSPEDARRGPMDSFDSLDGTWDHANGSDEWDGSRPGTGASGGVCIDIVTGAGENGGDASVLTVVDAEPSPSGSKNNRKLYFIHRIGDEGTSDDILETGVTLIARWRVLPDLDPTTDGWQIPDGADSVDPVPGYRLEHGGKGSIGLRGAAHGQLFSMVWIGRTEMAFNPEGAETRIDAGDATELHSIWVTIEDPELDGLYAVTAYIDGSLIPAVTTEVGLGDGMEFGYESTSYLAIGAHSSEQTGAFQLDYFGYAVGVHGPTDGDCARGFTCSFDPASGRVTGSWTPADAADGYRVIRNGEVLLPLTTGTSFDDPDPPRPAATYEVVTILGGDPKPGCWTRPCTVPVVGCPTDLRCVPRKNGSEVVLSWSLPFPGDVETYRILRSNGEDPAEVIFEGPIPENVFVDGQDPAPEAHYTLVAVVDGSEALCSPETCVADTSFCLSDLGTELSHDGSSVTLSWKEGGKVEWIEVLRNGELLAQPPAGGTGYTDTPAPGVHRYEIRAATADGACPVLSSTVCTLASEHPMTFLDEGREWDYVLDPKAPDAGRPGLLQFNATPAAKGNLDGTWARSEGSDAWDGSVPEAYAPAPRPPAPGGIGILAMDDGLDFEEGHPQGLEDGFYLFYDPGDPTNDGWPDPSNRKLFLGHDLTQDVPDDLSVTDLTTEGVTLYFRWRLRPPAYDETGVEVREVNGSSLWIDPEFQGRETAFPAGHDIHHGGKGHVGLYIDSRASPGPDRSLAFTLDGQGALVFTSGSRREDPGTPGLFEYHLVENSYLLPPVAGIPNAPGPVPGTARFTSVWLCLEKAEEVDPDWSRYRLRVWLNDAAAPAIALDGTADRDGDGEPDWFYMHSVAPGRVMDNVGPGTGQWLGMGCGNTDDVATMELDFLKFAKGCHPPTNIVPSQQAPEFIRMDVTGDGKRRLDDVIVFLSRYLFAPSGTTLSCPDAADANDDGKLGLTDVIYLLSFLFLPEGRRPAALDPVVCGEDPTRDNLDEQATTGRCVTQACP